ncbi:MAG: crotonase/enoyl-CoA hydratase family protein [Acidimicrobiia bacterium]|nr:crotonase/enoyl-CoA hydratase family protein [Acidimicrobiia bacterium]
MAVHYELRGEVAVITIDRPERRNAINRATAMSLHDAWQRFEGDSDARVGILTGAGGSFSAGADLKDFDLIDDPHGFLGFTRQHGSKPTIAAVSGYAVAGGLEIALWCDMRVASEDAVFGCFERRFGVPLVDGGTQRLRHVVGLGRALDMILTGRAVGAHEALSMGLVNRVVPPGRALESAVELAREIAAFPQSTVRSDRAAVYDGLDLETGLAAERVHGLKVLEEAAGGASNFADGAGRHGDGVERRC